MVTLAPGENSGTDKIKGCLGHGASRKFLEKELYVIALTEIRTTHNPARSLVTIQNIMSVEETVVKSWERELSVRKEGTRMRVLVNISVTEFVQNVY